MRDLRSTCALGFVLAWFGTAQAVSAQGGPPPLPDGVEMEFTESGLGYAVIRDGGDAIRAKPGDYAVIHYTGWVKSSGEQIDSSHANGRPARFAIGKGPVEGWNESVQLMPRGSVYRFEFPPELAYGDRQPGPLIPPNSTLVFDVQLLDVIPLPTLPPANPEAQIELEEGIVYEVLHAGEGPTCTDQDPIVVHYTVFTPDGRLLDFTKGLDYPARGLLGDMPLPLLKRVPLLMKKGGVLRVEASKQKGLDRHSPPGIEDTVWLVELIDIREPLPIPDFSAPPDDELETSESGLKWKVVREGRGESPQRTDNVVIQWAGRLLDGTVFDSSFARAEPLSSPIQGMLYAWMEGIPLMKPGEIRIFVVRPQLAYGKRGFPPLVGPDQTLVYWIELLRVGT